MYIESIHIVSFGPFSNYRLDFICGLNVIEGKNESGKSTLCDFIRFIFYGFAEKYDRENHIGFNSDRAEGSAVINCNEKKYRIERRTVGAKESCSVIDIESGKKVFEGKIPGEVFFGMNRTLFESTVFIGQASGGKINGRETSEAVENLLFSADETVSVKKSLRILEKARTELYHKNKKGGRIFELNNAISVLNEKLYEASEISKEIISLNGEKNELEKHLKHEEAQAEQINAAICDFEMLEVRKRKLRLTELEKDYRDTVSKLSEFRSRYTRNGFFPDNDYYENLKKCGEEISRCNNKIKETETELEYLNDEIRERETDIYGAEEKYKNKKKKLMTKKNTSVSIGIICCVFAIVSAAGAAVMFSRSEFTFGLTTALFAVVFFSVMILGLVFSSKYINEIKIIENERENQDDFFRARLDVIKKNLETFREEKRKYKVMFDDFCHRWDVGSSSSVLSEVKDVLEGEEAYSHEAELKRVAYISFKTDSEEKSVYDPEDDGRDIFLPEGFDYKEYKRRLAFLTSKIKLDGEKAHKNEIRLTQLAAKGLSAAEILENINSLEYEKKMLSTKFDALVLACEKIEEASSKMRDAVSPRLSSIAGRYMDAVTNGKYDDIGVDNGFAISFRPETADGGRITKGEEFMSAGTADAAYVSLRLAIASLICGENNIPPLVFDESFSRFDDERLENMIKILLSSGSQVLLLTSLERDSAIAQKISDTNFSRIRLEGFR